MADVINLRQARKARKRAASEQTAAANRARFGLTVSEKRRQSAETERDGRLLDGAKRETD